MRAVVPAEDLPTALSQNQARQHVAGLLGGTARRRAVRRDAVAAVRRRRRHASPSPGCCWAGSAPTCPRRPARRPRRRPRQDLAEGIRVHRAPPSLPGAHRLVARCTNLAVNALFFVAVLRLIEGGFAAYQIGLVETAAGVCGILGAVVAPWLIDRVPTGRLTVLVAWSFLPLVVPMALWNHPAVVAAALSVGLFLNPAGNAGIGAYRMAVTPPELIGRVQATIQFVSMAAMPLAPVLAGILLAGVGGGAAVAALGLLTATVALIPTLSTSVRSVPRPAAWERLVPERQVATAA